MKSFMQNVACVLFMGCVLLFIAWIAGYNFDGTWDDLKWDHPTNYNDTALHPEAR